MKESRDAAPRRLLIEAAREFNAGRYFEAHEVIEDGLEDVPDELWDLFVGLIQVAVGYHKVTQQLWPGAARMLGLGLAKIDRFAPSAAGLRLDALRSRARSDLEALRAQRFDSDAFAASPPRIQLRRA